MLAVVVLLTAAVLTLVQARMRTHVREDIASTLQAESTVYAKIEEAQRAKTQESAALVADLPSLKALMSTNDELTVQDASESLLDRTGADLLALEGANGKLLAFHARSDIPISNVRQFLRDTTGRQDWWFAAGHLFDVSVVPIVAGAGSDIRPLGRIVLGREVSPHSLAEAGGFTKSNLIFEQQGSLILGSLPAGVWPKLQGELTSKRDGSQSMHEVAVEGERYLVRAVELSGQHPVQLYCLQSYDQATEFLRSLNRMLLTLGVVAVLAGALIVFAISRQITRPLERLVQGTRHLGKGEFEFQIAAQGADEVAELTTSFEQMRNSLKKSRDGMLRSARLEAVGRLAGGVAHDFNNLVMIIKGYSDLLLDSATPETKPFIEEIKQAGDRATALTRQLLAFSRKQVLEPQVLEPNQTVLSMVKMLRVLIGEDIELVTKLSSNVGRVQADPGQLEQVIMNLAVNARDAMTSGGKLIIETQACELDEAYTATHSEISPGPFVLLAITDTGCGMSKEILGNIFEPFFTTKELGKGTGLGLATVYGIVKQSRGHVSVYSELGVGTTFKVYLPSVEKPVTAIATQPAKAVAYGSGTLLLVEDELPLRRLAAESLKRLGYDVLQAGNGLEALAVADRHPGEIDIIITDVIMPKMGGPELVERLREKQPNVMVIFMSGYTEAAVVENAKVGNGAILLNKPFSSDSLARAIKQLQMQNVH
jgi:signal transduction histidine kinase/CheY-like chemotaxis protein